LPNEIILARNAIGVNLFLVGFDEAALAAHGFSNPEAYSHGFSL
jgi:hypothetical protein